VVSVDVTGALEGIVGAVPSLCKNALRTRIHELVINPSLVLLTDWYLEEYFPLTSPFSLLQQRVPDQLLHLAHPVDAEEAPLL
jgi:hypothetical protein